MNRNVQPTALACWIFCCSLAISAWATETLNAATHRTKNFVVHAPTAEIAQQVADAAEVYRRELALEWLGMEFDRWKNPCPITVTVGTMGAGGATTFTFDRGQVYNWNMRIQGSLERILDSVLPHEISHTIFATHFRRPLPRWADEGAATLVEHESERRRQSLLARQLITDRTKIPLNLLLTIKEYPQDMQKVLMLYAEGYTLARFLVDRGGKPRFVKFLNEAHQSGWDRALKHHYEYASIAALEDDWQSWVMAGEPSSATIDAGSLARNDSPTGEPQKLLVRSQSPDDAPGDERPSKAPADGTATAQPTSAPATRDDEPTRNSPFYESDDEAEPLRPAQPAGDDKPRQRKERAIASVGGVSRNVAEANDEHGARLSKNHLTLPVIYRTAAASQTRQVARPGSESLNTPPSRLPRERLTVELPKASPH